jgi:hypothetical protein
MKEKVYISPRLIQLSDRIIENRDSLTACLVLLVRLVIDKDRAICGCSRNFLQKLQIRDLSEAFYSKTKNQAMFLDLCIDIQY